MGKLHRTTIAERLRLHAGRFTHAEERLVTTILANYPVSGLSTITELAQSAGVSTPTVLRLAKKLGFAGFPSLQAALKDEVAAQLQNPIAKHDLWSDEAPETHILNRFAAAVLDNLRSSLKLLDHREFDRIADLLANQRRAVHIIGGRITKTLAEYLFTHLHMVRPGVSLMPGTPALWPQYLLNMGQEDVLVIFDVRRYDPLVLDLARLAKSRGAAIVLFTDQWMSPIAALASHSLHLRIEAPSSWDSNIVSLFLIESLIAAIINFHWPETQRRIKELEKLVEAQSRGSGKN
jgi:DNA-binding MurR/RpiR family transcriptional regulator